MLFYIAHCFDVYFILFSWRQVYEMVLMNYETVFSHFVRIVGVVEMRDRPRPIWQYSIIIGNLD